MWGVGGWQKMGLHAQEDGTGRPGKGFTVLLLPMMSGCLGLFHQLYLVLQPLSLTLIR